MIAIPRIVRSYPLFPSQPGSGQAVITVSPAEPRDAAAIAALLEDLSRFYGAAGAEPLDVLLAQIDGALFARPPIAWALLARDEPARDGGGLAGLAAYSYLWPAIGATRSLYLKELYVRDTYRGQGVGKLLMQAVFEAAARCGCGRVEWTTDVGNAAARAFYAGLGVPEYPSKVFYRVERPR
jgi:GNAT superfamily N-acetyltransferase